MNKDEFVAQMLGELAPLPGDSPPSINTAGVLTKRERAMVEHLAQITGTKSNSLVIRIAIRRLFNDMPASPELLTKDKRQPEKA